MKRGVGGVPPLHAVQLVLVLVTQGGVQGLVDAHGAQRQRNAKQRASGRSSSSSAHAGVYEQYSMQHGTTATTTANSTIKLGT